MEPQNYFKHDLKIEFNQELTNMMGKTQVPGYYVFESMVAVVFQSIFYSEMHQNNIFLFKKLIFNINISK